MRPICCVMELSDPYRRKPNPMQFKRRPNLTHHLNRRSLLASIGATGLASMTASNALAAPRRPFFQRIGKPIGLQLYLLGDAPARDLEGTFARVAEIGYRDIEMPGLFGRKPADVKAAADRVGLTISSLHIPGDNRFNPGEPTLSGDVARVADEAAGVGVKFAVLPIVLFPDGFIPKSIETFGQEMLARLTADQWKRTADLLNRNGAALKNSGISLCYHNHNLEFAPVGNETGWEIIARETDPDLVHFELDVGWLAAAGHDPVAFLRRYRGRVKLLHVKDLLPTTKTNFTIGVDSTEIGNGKLDWARLLTTAHGCGVEHYYVEQEPPFALDRFESAQRSFTYLQNLKA